MESMVEPADCVDPVGACALVQCMNIEWQGCGAQLLSVFGSLCITPGCNGCGGDGDSTPNGGAEGQSAPDGGTDGHNAPLTSAGDSTVCPGRSSTLRNACWKTDSTSARSSSGILSHAAATAASDVLWERIEAGDDNGCVEDWPGCTHLKLTSLTAAGSVYVLLLSRAEAWHIVKVDVGCSSSSESDWMPSWGSGSTAPSTSPSSST